MALKYPTGESLTGYLDSKIDTSIALGDSDNKIPTQKAVKEYVDNKIDIPGLTEKTNSTVLDKTYIYDVVANSLKKIDIQNLLNPDGKAIVPIGFTYMQLPGKPAPSALFHGGWNDISASFAGAFFRVAGGNAKTFGGGQQSAQNLAHVHSNSVGNQSASHNHVVTIDSDAHSHFNGAGYVKSDNPSIYGSTASGVPGAAGDSMGTNSNTPNQQGLTNSNSHTHTNTVGNQSASHNHVVTINSEGGDDLRPINYTVKVWERVS